MIRRFRPEDMEKCVRVFIDAYNGEPWNDHWTPETAARYLGEFASGRRFVGFVAEEGEEIVGAVFARAKTWWRRDEIFVDELFVGTDHRRMGHGRALLGHVEEHARTEGLAAVCLLTNPRVPAKEFYDQGGYQQADSVVFLFKRV